MGDRQDQPAPLATLRLLQRAVADLNAARDLQATLQAAVDGVVSSLGFAVAAVTTVRPDGDLEVAALAGSDEARRALGGRVSSRASWDQLIAGAEVWGNDLRYLRVDQPRALGVPGWTSDAPADGEDAEAWHRHDALFAPLRTPERQLVGVLSVDQPVDGRRPGPWQLELLEMFACQVAIALHNARLHQETLRALGGLEREQRALRASEDSFRQAFENAPSGMAMSSLHDADRGRLLRVNDALCHLLGYSERQLRRTGLMAVTHPDDRRILAEQETSTKVAELRLVRCDGEALWVAVRSSVVFDSDGGPHFLLTHVEDIEDRKRYEETLTHRATHDSLTGLPNRGELHMRLQEILERGSALAVIFCDLDGFKSVNDTHGHHIGDTVLSEVARRLAAAVRDGDTVARVGGDEFVVVAEGVGAIEVEDLVMRLGRTFDNPITCERHQVRVAASFGFSRTDMRTTAEELLRTADLRMYESKRSRTRAAG
ncbi:MAG: diguanylate cyclase domain-containing protein [Carbonactinosporaceae bacterium]